MAKSHSLTPIDRQRLDNENLKELLNEQMVFVPASMPLARFPTLTELQEVIQKLDYFLEEMNVGDWYVISESEHTEIRFHTPNNHDDNSIEVWFTHGDISVLNIAQCLANICGSVFVVSHSNAATILFVPESVFKSESQPSEALEFFTVIKRRLPHMIARLADASLQDILFLLSQIRQALRRAEPISHHELYYLFYTAEQGLPAYRHLLNHLDWRVRYLTFDLIARFPKRLHDHSDFLKQAIENESRVDVKTHMIQGMRHLLLPHVIGIKSQPWTRSILDLLMLLTENREEALSVQIAAATVLAYAQPGLCTSAMQQIFIEVLVQPEIYCLNQSLAYNLLRETLETMETLLLNHRVNILITALPRITVAQYAHDVLRTLLDHVFLGTVRQVQMSLLPDTYPAERPNIDEATLRDDLVQRWFYSVNPTKLGAVDLLATQRIVLKTVMAFDIPWMVHSNLLEKYGLPATRSATRLWLNDGM